MTEPTMECKNCEQTRSKFFCEQCLRNHMREYAVATGHVATERDEHIANAGRALRALERGRERRADVATLQARLDEVKRNLKVLREKNASTQERLAELRASFTTRRKTLAQARSVEKPSLTRPGATITNTAAVQPPKTPALTLSRLTEAQAAIQDALSRARSGLVQELVEVFSIVEVGGRPPLGGKAGSKGEWTIGGLVLPVPGDIRRYPPIQINAVITHTIHFLGLLTFYLGTKLPFEISWSGGRLGVGQPSISAGKGTESGGWARWTSKNPLHLPLTPEAPSTATVQPSLPAAATNAPTAVEALTAVSQSYAELPLTAQPPASFTTALAMLLYNVAYLAHTQSVDVPLAHAGEVLRNLWGVCCSTDLGRRSHQTRPLLAPPTPPAFPLDFAQLLQATTANPRPRSGRPRSGSSGGAGTVGRARSKRQEIIVEEDEWDLVEDAAEGRFA